jgi:hypothetical protein
LKPKLVKVDLQGGIGNQLFMYFAGLYWAQENKAELVVNLGEIGVHGINHGADLSEFEIKCRLIKENQSIAKVFAKRLLRKISRNRLGFQIIGFLGHKVFYSSEIGYDEKLIERKKVKRIEGYFQTYRYFDELLDPELKSLKLKNETAWFARIKEELELIPFVAIHIRRGDFKNFSTNVGLLSHVYYTTAIRKIDLSLGESLPLIVFSDEISVAKVLLREYDSRIAMWVSPPKDSSPIESLLLMSDATGIVIANSTYSWWAAKLGRAKQVIAPEQWFRVGIAPRDLYPGNWQLVPSAWEN